MRNVKYFLAIAGFLCALSSEAQYYKFTSKKQYWSVGASANVVTYYGDLAPKPNRGSTDFGISITRPSLNIYGQKRLHPRITARVGVLFAQIAGDDFNASPTDVASAPRYQRNLHFRNNIFEASAVGIVDLFENQGVYYKRPSIPIPYFTAGIAVLSHNPEAKTPESQGGNWVALAPLRTEGVEYSRISLAVPVGIGVRYRVTPNIDIAFEANYRIAFTDYLDDVSGKYADPGAFGDDNLARIMSDRSLEPVSAFSGEARDAGMIPAPRTFVSEVDGRTYVVGNGFGTPVDIRGSADNDAYFVTGFHVIYIFSGTVKTPKFR